MPESVFVSSVPIYQEEGTTASVALSDRSELSKQLVQSRTEALQLPFGRSQVIRRVLVAATRPGEWLLLGSRESVREIVDTLGNDEATTVDMTHGLAVLRLIGPRTTSVLEKLSDLDFADAMTPNGAVVSGYVAGVVCDLIRLDQSGERAYLIVSDRSYGRYLSDAIQAAMTEFLEKRKRRH